MDFCIPVKLASDLMQNTSEFAKRLAEGTRLYVKEFNDGHIEIADKL